jgi:SSS family transporter
MGTLDWAICVVYLAVVFFQGWWFAREETTEGYFVGERRMHWLAVGLSLFATSFSTLSFVGLPREAAYEDYHLYLAILFIPLFVAPVVGWLFVPLFHRLRLTSAYEYLELRFNRPIRRVGSLLFCLYTVGWMGSMLYATALILQVVVGLSDSQRVWLLIALGAFTTFYTSVGGYQAVVWTDAVQAVVIGGSIVLILLLGIGRVDGGWGTVWRLGLAHHKFEMFDLRFDLRDRANFYAASAYGLFVYLSAHATAQTAAQRYVSMPSVAAARRSLVVHGVMVAVVCLLFFVLGSVLFAYYHQGLSAAAPAGSGFPDLPKQDQLTVHFVRTELAFPGLVGLLLAGLLAAGMSSIDSGINSLTALVVCDWWSGRALGVIASRLLCVMFGLSTVVTALLVPGLGEHVFDIIITIAGAFFGPLLGLFLLGMLMPRANSGGATAGLLAGAVALSSVVLTPISRWWYGAFTCVPTFVVGALASLLFAAPSPDTLRGLVVGRGRSPSAGAEGEA